MTTNKPTHTAGPWKITEGADHENDALIISQSKDPERYACHIINDGAGEITDEDRANARLIAAAPELLAACKAILPDLEMWQPRTQEERAATVLIRAAIARTEEK